VAEPVDQPSLGDDLHPGANAGGAGANPHQTEIAILECFKDPAEDLGRASARGLLGRCYGQYFVSVHESGGFQSKW
jgi:hypothetical protein